ncbi:MAG: ABC transporter ATP-binding protein [Chlorobi bacterium]|nr:ABC transporter ATP-binding protein [Chlorobiota bacterium]
MSLLNLKNLTMRFGGLTAVDAVTETIEPLLLMGLIGPNGAGKTTVFNMITGVYLPTEGQISFDGQNLVGQKPHEIAGTGIARTFQNIRLFPSLSVFDNVRVGFNNALSIGILGSILQPRSFWRGEKEIAEKIDHLLEMFGLLDQRNELAKNLSYGDQRRVEIVRAMATDPKLLLLDEPAAGMNPTEKQKLMSLIRYLRDEFQIAILLIEHDMHVVMGICERITVLDHGAKIASGTPEEVKNNPEVVKAYLGHSE